MNLAMLRKGRKPARSRSDKVMHGLLWVVVFVLAVILVLPLLTLFSHSLGDTDGNFIGLANFRRFLADPALSVGARNSLFIATVSTVLTILLALGFAYGLTRSLMPFRKGLRAIAMMPLLAPSLLPAIALIFLFGQKGFARQVLMGHSIYGPIGIIIGEVVFSLPQAILILSTALATADQRLYDAAITLRAGPIRIFRTVTLPGIRYGLVSAALAVFVKVFTDFGVPAVIGGSYPVLATEVYRQVVAQFDFGMGAVTGIFLLLPAVLAFLVQRWMQSSEITIVSSAAVPLSLRPQKMRDRLCLALCLVVAAAFLMIIGFAVFGSIVTYWPYNLTPTLKFYQFAATNATGWGLYLNSLVLSLLVATLGGALTFAGASLVERTPGASLAKAIVQLLAMLPLAVPGLVLGLSYIFFFNNPANPLSAIYGTMAILVLSSVAHFYTVPHMLATAALKQLDRELDVVAASMKVPFHTVMRRVTLPFCLPTVIDVWSFLFVNAMTTVSAVVFLYSARTLPAAVAIVQWNDNGRVAEAAAMSVTIFTTSALIMAAKTLILQRYLRRSQAWRQR